MADPHHGNQIKMEQQSGIHGSSNTNLHAGDGCDDPPISDEDLRVLVEVIFEEMEKYEQIFQDKLKKRIIRYVSERDKNYHSRESKLWPLYFSIGPTHHGDPDLQPIESAKFMHLARLMMKVESPREFLIECLQGLKSRIDAITLYYDFYRQCLSYFSIGQILKMILLDACFIIHLNIESKQTQGNQLEWIEIDLTLAAITYMKKSSALRDLLLFENQIPFDIIDFIWKLLEKHEAIDELDPPEPEQEDYSPKLIRGMVDLFNFINEAPHGKQHYQNLLDFYHRALPSVETNELISDGSTPSIPSATELEEVGTLKFRLKKNTKNINGFMDINYEEGELNLPLTNFSFARKEILQSLLAFECDGWRKNLEPNNKIHLPKFKVFPYIHFMAHLVQNVEDATILMKAGIFDHACTSMDDIVNFFSHLLRPYKFIKDLEIPTFQLGHHINIDHSSAWNSTHDYVDDSILIDELLKGLEKFRQLTNKKSKNAEIFYESEREKNYHTRKLRLPLYFSIGPRYHGDPDLQKGESGKVMHLALLMSKMTSPQDFLKECLQGLKKMDDVKNKLVLYNLHQKKRKLSKTRLLKMDLLDASLVIDFILICQSWAQEIYSWIMMDITHDGTTFINISSALSDLLLVSNEISFDVIEFIWNLLVKHGVIVVRESQEPEHEVIEILESPEPEHEVYSSPSLIEGMLNLFNLKEVPQGNQRFKSLLDFYHWALPVAEGLCIQKKGSDYKMDKIPSATELEKVGVKFRLKEVDTCKSYLDITFKDGKLNLPLTNISIARKQIFYNMLWFEYLHIGASNNGCEQINCEREEDNRNPPKFKIFPYIYLMTCLLRNGEDAKILMNAGIFDNEIGSVDDIAHFFSDLWRPYIEFKFLRFKLHKAINKWHKSKWNKFKAASIHNFLANPLIIFSVVSAITILVLTFFKTINDHKQ